MFSKYKQHCFNKIKVMLGQNTCQCHKGLQEACGQEPLPYRTVARQVCAFLHFPSHFERHVSILPQYSMADLDHMLLAILYATTWSLINQHCSYLWNMFLRWFHVRPNASHHYMTLNTDCTCLTHATQFSFSHKSCFLLTPILSAALVKCCQ
jgi:hypothetical protein